jgi:hypothetical protein
MHVIFGTPTYDKTVSVDHHTSSLDTVYELTKQGVSWGVQIVAGKAFIDLARNEIVDAFLKTDATDLFFIDADVGWDAKVITRFLSYPHGVVAGLVPKRSTQSDCDFHQNALTGVMDQGLFQSLEAPTAFMRVKRSVFERLRRPYFLTGSSEADFGEDIYFCRRWCELGEFVWIDSDVTFSHRGDRVWKGNFYEHAVKTGLLRS